MTALEGKALLEHGTTIARRYASQVGWQVAEELGAEAVARALGRPPRDGRMGPWLERIYRNLLVDWWRRRRTTVELGDALDVPGGITPEDHALQQERRRVVRASLRALPREARRALLGRFYADLDDELAADRFAISPPTVRTRIHRALARLRARLGELGAWLPPLFGKLGAQVLAVGAAPVIVAALVVAAAHSPARTVAMPPAVVPMTLQVPMLPVRAQVLAPAAVAPSTPARPAKKLTAASGAPTLAAASVAIETEAVVAQILEPEAIEVLAEPQRPVAPCMVEAPPHFLAEIDKMIEEHL